MKTKCVGDLDHLPVNNLPVLYSMFFSLVNKSRDSVENYYEQIGDSINFNIRFYI